MLYRISHANAAAIREFAEAERLSRLARLWQAFRAYFADIRRQFVAIVVVPTLVVAVYYGFIATGQYVSHAEFIVRGVNSHRSAGLGALLTTIGISRAADDTSAIETFIKSRDAIQQLAARVDLREIYGRPEADFFSRYPRPGQRDTFERLYSRSQNFISIIQDQATGITSLDVAAFRPEDARVIASTLLELAEGMVNRMNGRVDADTVSGARKEVERARLEVVRAQAELTAFRNKEALVDPVSYAGVLLEAISQLSLEQAQTQAQIDQTSSLSHISPGIASLQAKSDALEKKIADERQHLAGNDAALAEKVSTYERLTLMRDLAYKSYGSALLALQSAQQEAQHQQIYIENMVNPNLPDEHTKPERLRLILTAFVLSFAVFSMIWIVSVGAKDHAQ